MKSGNLAFSGKQKLTMLVFFGTFLLMIYAVVPWSDLGIDLLPTLGWWFDELSTLFFSASILIALINRMPESNYVATFLSGARDLIGVALVVAVARGIYVVLTSSPTLALRVTGGGFPLLGDSCSRSTGFLLHRAA